MRLTFFCCIASCVLLYSYPEENFQKELHPLDTMSVKIYGEPAGDFSQMASLPNCIIDSSDRKYIREEFDPYDSLYVNAYIESMNNLCQVIMWLPNCVIDSSNREYIHVVNVSENWSFDVLKPSEIEQRDPGYLIRFSSIEYLQGKSVKKTKKEFIDKYTNFPPIVFKCISLDRVGSVENFWTSIYFYPQFDYGKYFFNLKNAVMIYREYTVSLPYHPMLVVDNYFYDDKYYVYYQDGRVVEYTATKSSDAVRQGDDHDLIKRVLNE